MLIYLFYLHCIAVYLQAQEKAKKAVVKKNRAPSKSHSKKPKLTDPIAVMEKHKQIESTGKYQEMLARRKKLPASGFKQDVINCVHSNQVTIISGETGIFFIF